MISGRRTLSQAVTEAILERIRAGVYRPGDRLATERGLMEEYGVGRNVAREAVQALVAMGLVDVRPGRGAVIVGVETERAVDAGAVSALLLDQTIDDLNEFRSVIEVEIATRAAERATPADVAAMRSHLDVFRQRHEAGLSVTEPEVAFHEALARASHNAIYAQVVELLHERLALARDLVDGLEWSRARAIEDHEAILAAIEAHDATAARAAMRTHMELAFEAMAEARRLHAAAAGASQPKPVA